NRLLGHSTGWTSARLGTFTLLAVATVSACVGSSEPIATGQAGRSGGGAGATGGMTAGGGGSVGVAGRGNASGSVGAGGAAGAPGTGGASGAVKFGANIRLNDDTGSADQMETMIAAGPNGLLLASWVDYRSGLNCGYTSSTDGGATWAKNFLIKPANGNITG